jgi:hypothetical protein
MGNRALLRRVLPFLATFAVGIFIASFFVNVAPSFGGAKWKARKAECKRLKFENEQLRNENFRLKQEMETRDLSDLPGVFHERPVGVGPEFPVEMPVAPPPPPAPRRNK